MHTNLIVCAVLAASVSSVAAQNQPPTTAPKGAPSTPSPGGNQTVRVTGCVASDDIATAAATSAARSGFVLTNARMSNDSPTGTAQPSAEDIRAVPQGGAAVSNMTSTAGMRYVLTAQSTDLKPHVGHQVEITGQFDVTPSYPSGVATSGSTTPPATGSTTGAPAATGTGGSMPQTLKVESVRMIAASCAAAK